MQWKRLVCGLALVLALAAGPAAAEQASYPVVDTGQKRCYDDKGVMACPSPGRAFYGQDAQYEGNEARYRDNGDGTVSDLVTGLMWIKERGGKMPWAEAVGRASECRVGGYADWRAPTIKEVYSLIDFRGRVGGTAADSIPYIDTRYFDYAFGDTSAGERVIDCQDWSATKYVGTTMGGQATAFGVNFADGRIKGYPTAVHGGRGKRYMRYVRGNPDYGKNAFADNRDGTVTDRATTLVWQQADSGKGMDWEHALAYCQDLSLAGRDDWRLPNAKELQSIVDYARSPKATGSAAIDPVFAVTDPESYYWTSTTHLDGRVSGENAVYVAFGRAMGNFSPPRSSGGKRWMDVHGAGAQRSDPKSGDPSAYAQGFGPQGDDRRIMNYARCVRGGGVEALQPSPSATDIPPWATAQAAKSGGRTQGQGYGMGQERGQGMMGQPGRGMGQGMMGRSGQGMGPGMMDQSGQAMGQGMGGRQGPPSEALDACSGKSQDDSCSFSTPRGTLSGVCRSVPEGLACVPGRGQGGGPGMQGPGPGRQ